jgi:hypothetical protein
MVKFRCQVYARLRPPREGQPVAVQPVASASARALEVSLPLRAVDSGAPDNQLRSHQFVFDGVLLPGAKQSQVYKMCAAEAIESFLRGYNATVFAYGQTGSGKTHAITGGAKFSERGIVPRALSHVFEHLERHSEESAFSLFVSYLEVYNESVYDLLDTDHARQPLERWPKVELRESQDGKLHLHGLRVYEARTEDEALRLLFLGNTHRMTAETPMNRASSRSHCVFTLKLEQRSLDSDVVKTSKLHLVDLAGSERVWKPHRLLPTTAGSQARSAGTVVSSAMSDRSSISGVAPHVPRRSPSPASFVESGVSVPSSAAASGMATHGPLVLKEGRFINLSLLYLEKVILALYAKSRKEHAGGGLAAARVHVPYRNTVITSVLRDSLGGNCKTVFIATLNAEATNAEETLSTCRFIKRCGMLSSDVIVNEQRDLNALVARLERDKAELQARVERLELSRQSLVSSLVAPKPLTMPELRHCEGALKAYLRDPVCRDSSSVRPGMREMHWGETLSPFGKEVTLRILNGQERPHRSGSVDLGPREDPRLPGPRRWSIPTPVGEPASAHSIKSVVPVRIKDAASQLLAINSSLHRTEGGSESDAPVGHQPLPEGWLYVSSMTEAQWCIATMRDILRETLSARKDVPEPSGAYVTQPSTPVTLEQRALPSGAYVTQPSTPVTLEQRALPLASASKAVTPPSIATQDVDPSRVRERGPIEEAATTVASAVKPPAPAATREDDASAASPARSLRIAPLALRGLLTHGAVFVRHRGPSPGSSPTSSVASMQTSRASLRFVWCSADLSTLFWRPVASTDRVAGIDAASLTAVLVGKQTPSLTDGTGRSAPPDTCFSLISTQESLDLQIQTEETPEELAKARDARGVWLAAFRFLLERRGGGIGRADSEQVDVTM